MTSSKSFKHPQGDRLEAVKRILCERSFYEFVKQGWQVLEPDTPFDPAWHIEYLCELMEQVAPLGAQGPAGQGQQPQGRVQQYGSRSYDRDVGRRCRDRQRWKLADRR